MRRSEWRRRADDPKTPLGWWWRGIVAHEWPFHLCVSVSLGAAIVTRIVWVAGVGIAATLTSVALQMLRTSDRLAPMLPDPAPPGQFRAKVEYRQKGLTTGRDEMALTVVDGWLHAEGVRSHFALRSEDVWKLTTGSDRRGRLVLSDGEEVRLAGLGDPARIVLERWHRPGRWMEGEPTFPPAQVHPQETAWWCARIWSGLLICYLATMPKLVGSFFHLDGLVIEWAFVFAFLLGVLVALSGQLRVARLGRTDESAKKEGLPPPKVLAGQAPPLGENREPLTARRTSE